MPPDNPKVPFEEFQPLVVPRPASMQWLLQQTKFTRDELRRLYRFFKQLCPNGVLTEQDFKDVYKKLFPHGDSKEYAQYVFRGFDLNKDGYVCFEDMAESYSVLTRGDVTQKLRWIYDLYDTKWRGKLNRADLADVVQTLRALLTPPDEINSDEVCSYAFQIFERWAPAGKHFLTKKAFVDACQDDPQVLEALEAFIPFSILANPV